MYEYLVSLADFFNFEFGDVYYFSGPFYDIFANIFLTLGLLLILMLPMLILRKLFFVLVGD